MKHVILAAGFVVLFIGGGARFGIGLTLKPSVEELGWGRGTLGATVAIFMIVSAVAMFIAGRMADRASPRAVITIGLVLSGLGLGFMSAVSEAWEAILFYGVVFAIGQGMASVAPVGVLITRAFPGRTGFANAVAMSGMCAGQLVMMAVMASVLTEVGWRAVYVLLGLAHVLVLPVAMFATAPRTAAVHAAPSQQAPDIGMREAIRSRQFLILLAIYAICGLDDFFVSTHVVAFAQDQGIDALLSGHLLALMGLTGLIGVVAAGVWSDSSGPAWPAFASFVLRILAFGLVLIDQSTLSVAIFALAFGVTFLVTAPLTVIFVRDAFGQRNLGALVGLITMVHHICGGFGAWLGAVLFDRQGSYATAFAIMFVSSVIALVLTQQMLKRGQTRRV